MTRRGEWGFVLVALCGSANLRAQQAANPSTLRGVVLSAEISEPIPYSVVELAPGFPRRLTDDSGRFHFAGARPGRYRLSVRQIGFLPFDSVITVPAAGEDRVVIRLMRVGITLPAVTVIGSRECRTPGPPDPGVTPELAAVFEQVVENARRYRLLADSFPHQLVMERVLREGVPDGDQAVTTRDTLHVSGGNRWAYRPGHVMGNAGRTTLMRVPSLWDFADTLFAANHCFQLAGRDTLLGGTFVRLDFEPPATLKETDLEGSVYLDSTRYVIAYTVVRLTRPRQSLRGVNALTATSRFREVIPSIVVPDFVRAVTRPRNQRTADRTEELRLLELRFERAPGRMPGVRRPPPPGR